jgi:hypothetical protein
MFVSAGLNARNKLTITSYKTITFKMHWKWKIIAIQMYKSKFDVVPPLAHSIRLRTLFGPRIVLLICKRFYCRCVHMCACVFACSYECVCVWKRSGENVFCRAGKVSLLKISLTRQKFFPLQSRTRHKSANSENLVMPNCRSTPCWFFVRDMVDPTAFDAALHYIQGVWRKGSKTFLYCLYMYLLIS